MQKNILVVPRLVFEFTLDFVGKKKKLMNSQKWLSSLMQSVENLTRFPGPRILFRSEDHFFGNSLGLLKAFSLLFAKSDLIPSNGQVFSCQLLI